MSFERLVGAAANYTRALVTGSASLRRRLRALHFRGDGARGRERFGGGGNRPPDDEIIGAGGEGRSRCRHSSLIVAHAVIGRPDARRHD